MGKTEKAGGLPEFRPNMKIEVLTIDNRLIFMGRVRQVEGNVLSIQEETGAKLPYIEYNEVIKLRGFSDSESFTVAGQIGGSTASVWKVDRIRALQAGEQRQYFRQTISVDTELICANAIFDRERGGPLAPPKSVPCRLVDISAGGVAIRCDESFEEGDWLLVVGVQLLPGEVPYSFTCKVLRVSGKEKPFQYGCSLCYMSTEEQERLVRTILALQRRALQARRNER